MKSRTVLAFIVATMTGLAAVSALTPMSNAASGTGVYAAWSLDTPPSQGQATFAGTIFPEVTLTSKDSNISVARSATLTGLTSFGAVYGTSRGETYLTSGLASGKSEGVLTFTFATPPVPGTWGFVVGDVDAEDIKVSAKDANGNPVDVREWEFIPFNYANESDQPAWTLESERILGNGSDTSGASMWVTPTSRVSSVTLTQVRLSGFPQYQLWIAADVLTAVQVAPPTTPDSVCTATDTNLVNGDFELPFIPATSYRQIEQRDVPGWDTTATDRKIEIWSSGFSGVVASEGKQFAELNATQPSELYQVVDTVPGELLTWSLLHRARAAGATGDTMSVNIGLQGATPNASYTFTDGLSAGWVRHTGAYPVPDGQTRTRFGFESGPTASGSRSVGNFLDDIYFTTTECIPQQAAEGSVVSPSPSVSPSVSPSPSASGDPGVPTVITVTDLPDAPAGSTITSVEDPANGKAVVLDGTVIFTPDPGFRGTEKITVIIVTPNGQTDDVTVEVVVGKTQVVTTNWQPPKKLVLGTNKFAPVKLVTNAKQSAQVTASCSPLLRVAKMDGSGGPRCVVTVNSQGTFIEIEADEPIGVEILVRAPRKGEYGPLRQTYFFRVSA